MYLTIYILSVIGTFALGCFIAWNDQDGRPTTRRDVLFGSLLVLIPIVNTIICAAILVFWSIELFEMVVESKPLKAIGTWLDQPIRRA